MVMLLLVGICNSLYLTGGVSVLQQLVPDRLRGRVMGIYGMTWSLSSLGMAQAGFVAQYTNAPVAVASGALVLIIVAVLILIYARDIRSLRGGISESLRVAYQETAVPAGS